MIPSQIKFFKKPTKDQKPLYSFPASYKMNKMDQLSRMRIRRKSTNNNNSHQGLLIKSRHYAQGFAESYFI